jgi:hypothetical protein
MDKNILAVIIVILVIIVLIVGAILFMRFTEVGRNIGEKILPESLKEWILGKSKFTVLEEIDKKVEYDLVVEALINKTIKYARRHTVLTPGEVEHIRRYLRKEAEEGYDEGRDLGDVIGSGFMSVFDDLKKTPSMELIIDIEQNVLPKSKDYLTYRARRYTHPIRGISPESKSRAMRARSEPIRSGIPISSHITEVAGRKIVKPIRLHKDNIVTKQIAREHAGVVRTPHMGINATNLTAGIKKRGFSTVTKGKKSADFRGRIKAQVRRLAGLTSTKDPNSLSRFASGSVRDLLATSKGFSNESMFHNAYETYMTRIRDPEHHVYKNLIRGRFVDPGKTVEMRSNTNMMSNIIHDVKG